MAATFAKLLILVLTTTSMLAATTANRGWDWGHYKPKPKPTPKPKPMPMPMPMPRPAPSPKKIVVGGSENWHFGFDYNQWAFRNGPFFENDTLIFKYDQPVDNTTFPHSVYLLPDWRSFWSCDLSKGKMIANPTQGGGNGFEFVLEQWKPYFFACGEHDGIHCSQGKMKFFVMALPNSWRH